METNLKLYVHKKWHVKMIHFTSRQHCRSQSVMSGLGGSGQPEKTSSPESIMVRTVPLGNPENTLVPAPHTELGLMKNCAEGSDKMARGFHYVRC